VNQKRPALFRGRHFVDVIMLCVRWYLRYSPSSRDLGGEHGAERGFDHVTIWRWVQRYAPILNQRIRRELRRPIAPGGSMRPTVRCGSRKPSNVSGSADRGWARLRLIRAMLKAGSYGKGQLFPTEHWTPQGGVVSVAQ
jgi:hypothetical protein